MVSRLRCDRSVRRWRRARARRRRALSSCVAAQASEAPLVLGVPLKAGFVCFLVLFFNETLKMDPNLFSSKGRELVSPEWCLKGEHHGGTRATLAHTRTRTTRGTGTEEVRAWRHDVSAHVRGVWLGGW